MFSLTLTELLYVLAVSLQLSGALLLILRYWLQSVKDQVTESREKESRVEDSLLILGQTQPSVSELTENIWLNRFAFVCLFLGYLLGVWGEIMSSSKTLIFIWILCATLVITFVLFFGSRIIARRYCNGKT